MLKHYLLIIYRGFIRFKSTFIINLTGLSTGLACVLFIYLWVNDELHVDKFHEKDRRLFQAMERRQDADDVLVNDKTGFSISGTKTTLDALTDLSAAQINAEVVDVINTDVGAEVSAIPAAAPALRTQIQLVYQWLRNKILTTATTDKIHKDDGTLVGTSTLSDDGTTTTKGKYS